MATKSQKQGCTVEMENQPAIVAGRFRIQEHLASGAMGDVYRAFDLQTKSIIALKLANKRVCTTELPRFILEAQTLAEVQHQNIVQYIDHGMTEDSLPYLAMEWLAGPDLETIQMYRPQLTEAETVSIARQLCQALAALHERGISHRDLKPSNVIALGGDIDQIRLVDFGVAFAPGHISARITKPGMVIGTPSFIAPERVRGEAYVDVRSDLYSLGALLYNCLTGDAPIFDSNLTAMLLKLLVEPAPRVRETLPGVSPELDELIAQLLAKSPDDRPASATEVLARLDGLQTGPRAGIVGDSRSPNAASVSLRERNYFSVLLISRFARDAFLLLEKSLSEDANHHHKVMYRLADGTVLVVFATDTTPIEMSASAVHCALELNQRYPLSMIAVATGRGSMAERSLVGEVVDRVVRILGTDTTMVTHRRARIANYTNAVLVDDVTAGLVEKRFQLSASFSGAYAVTQATQQPALEHRLLGRNTQCLGRTREIATLHRVYDDCADLSRSRTMLVTGEAGIGKSRLGNEFLQQVKQLASPPAVWTAFADRVHQQATFGMLGQLLRRAIGISPTDPAHTRRAQLIDYLGDRAPAKDVARLAAFLGEFIDTPFADSTATILRDARRDPHLMHDHLRMAWEEWLEIETRERPIILVLEALHWSDTSSVKFIASAVRNLRDRPLMVLAMAQPEFSTRFPEILAVKGFERLHVHRLPYPSCQEIVREFLPDAPRDVVDNLVYRSEGNPYYLEELIRYKLIGDGRDIPDTILALVGARLRGLSAEQRRVLRAASVFGGEFSPAGICALVDWQSDKVESLLAELMTKDFVQPQRDSYDQDEPLYLFRQELVREAAYASLTEDDQVAAHLAAADFLATNERAAPMVLADHFQHGNQPQQACVWYQRAAESAMEANDMYAAIERATCAIKCGASKCELGELLLLQAEAYNWTSDHDNALRTAHDAMSLLPVCSDEWAHAAHQVAWASFATGQVDELRAVADALLREIPDRPTDEYLASMAPCIVNLVACEYQGEARMVARAMHRHLASRAPGLKLRGIVARVEGILASYRARWQETAEHLYRAIDIWKQLGSERSACIDQSNLATALSQLGQYTESARVLRECQVHSARAGLEHVSMYCSTTLAVTQARLGDISGALRTITRLQDVAKDRYSEAYYRICRARIYLMAGWPESTTEYIEQALELVDQDYFPHLLLYALAVQAMSWLVGGEPVKALECTEQGMSLLRDLGHVEEGDMLLFLAHAEALHDMGEHQRARATIIEARKRLLERAATIHSPTWHRSFLTSIDEHRRIERRWLQWTGSDADVERVPQLSVS